MKSSWILTSSRTSSTGTSFASAYEKLLIGHTPMISFITVAELYYGALKKGWGQKRIHELEVHLHQFAVVPYSLDVCVAYARIRTLAEAKGRPVPMSDAFIAACAVSLGIPLMTHNRRHFEKIDGLRVISAGASAI